MTRILYIMESTVGGTRKHLRQLVRYLNRPGFAISVICSALRDPSFLEDIQEFRSWGVTVYLVPMRREINAISDFCGFLKICGIIRKNRFDIIHTHSSKAGFLGRVAARIFSRAKIVHTPHTFAFLFQEEFSPIKRFLFFRIERILGLATDQMIAVSEGEKIRMLKNRIISEKKIEVIHNGYEDFAMVSESLLHQVRKAWKIPKDAPLIGTVGLLNPAKGHQYLIQAIPCLLKSFPDLKCIIVGDGPLRERLQNMVKALGLEKSVIFTGYRKNYRDFIAAMDIFAFPSLWEAMPYTLIEAMALGRPVVATRVDGCSEAVVPGETGILAGPRNHGELANAFETLIKSQEDMQRMGKNGAMRAKRFFRLDQGMFRLERLYVRIMTGNGKRGRK